MFSTMLVIGATVVTTLSFFSVVVAGFVPGAHTVKKYGRQNHQPWYDDYRFHLVEGNSFRPDGSCQMSRKPRADILVKFLFLGREERDVALSVLGLLTKWQPNTH
jgi:hypothetical protein